jgi:glutathione synthase/RimK-type ligase-like ATP-grasp enzyme
MNPIRDSSIIDNKFYQLDLAEKIGFSVPPYINSNKKKELIEFIRNNNPAAIKFMSQEIYTMPDGTFKGIYVNKINEIDLNDFQETSENPITIQKYIRKSFEVRHTYVDGYHFSCKIESQKSTISNVDWRRYDIKNTPHIPIEAPDEIKKLVEELMNHSNLIYGAFDFIVDDDNKWWYLEVNTSGQWLWIEDLAGLPISGRIAEALNARLKGDS